MVRQVTRRQHRRVHRGMLAHHGRHHRCVKNQMFLSGPRRDEEGVHTRQPARMLFHIALSRACVRGGFSTTHHAAHVTPSAMRNCDSTAATVSKVAARATSTLATATHTMPPQTKASRDVR